MKAYEHFKQGETLRSLFRKDLAGNLAESFEALTGACAKSTDPEVRGKYERWKQIELMATFLDTRKESDERE
jgi:hypothetical protein